MFIIFLFIWLAFNGRVTPEVLFIGCIIGGLIYLAFHLGFGYSIRSDIKFIVNLPLLLLYAVNLIREIIKASIQVGGMIWTPRRKPDPVLVEFRSGLSGPFSNVLLANSITLTPGTYTVLQEDDRFVVHCLAPEYAEGLSDSSFIHLLRRIKK